MDTTSERSHTTKQKTQPKSSRSPGNRRGGNRCGCRGHTTTKKRAERSLPRWRSTITPRTGSSGRPVDPRNALDANGTPWHLAAVLAGTCELAPALRAGGRKSLLSGMGRSLGFRAGGQELVLAPTREAGQRPSPALDRRRRDLLER